MSQTHVENPNMTTLMQRFVTLQATVSMTREELEDQLHTEVWRSDWQEVIHLLGLAEGKISRGAANECAVLAVQQAEEAEVASILDLLPEGEYTESETYYVDWSPTGEICRRLKWEVQVQGTLVMHAVAKNRPEILRLLLEWGHDVNCSSGAAAAALLRDHYAQISGYGRDYIPFYPYMARPENRVQLRKWDADPDVFAPLDWEGATPLALAILLGHADCARILLEYGAWLEEAPSVSAAMYLFWREKDPAYQAVRAMVLAEGNHTRHRPVLWAMGETCSPQQLKTALEAWDYDQQELSYAARRMVLSLRHQRDLWKTYTDGWNDLCRRIYRIGHLCPEAVQAKEVIGLLLDYFLSWSQVSIEPLLPLLEGATLDISEISVNIYDLNRPGAKKFFCELAERCRLVMDRDVIPPTLSVEALRVLLNAVAFLPPVAEEGVSGLTRAILSSGDLRLIRRALASGIIPPEESTEELLRCQQTLHLPPTCRSALLTTPRPKKNGKNVCPRITDMRYHWFADGESRNPRAVLDDPAWERHVWFALRNPFTAQTVQAAGMEWQLHKTFFAACMTGRTDIVEHWLDHMPPEELRNIESVCCAEQNVTLILSPLCAAALGGQTETVELLLRRGALLQEEICGTQSTFIVDYQINDKGTALPLNPVLAAALGGHWGTADYLLRNGTTCDWTAAEHQAIWRKFQPGNFAEAVEQHLKGGYLHHVSQ